MTPSSIALPKLRRRLLWWGAGLIALLVVIWLVLNHLMPVINPRLTVRKIDLPGARVRALARIQEGWDLQGPDAWRIPTGAAYFDVPWMRELVSSDQERYITPVQWSFHAFLRSGTKWEQRVVLEATSIRRCELCREEFLRLLPAQDARGRAIIAKCLGQIGDAGAVDELEKLWTDEAVEVRLGVLSGLQSAGRHGDRAMTARVLAFIRSAMRTDVAVEVREEAEYALLYLRCYCREDYPALPYDEELAELLRSAHEKVRAGLAESIVAAAWHGKLAPRWLELLRASFANDTADSVRGNAALALMLADSSETEAAREFLERHCPPETGLRPLRRENLRDALRRHLPHGLQFSRLQEDWRKPLIPGRP